ncbi:MAG: hypothetical protein E3K40_05560 [Candidatus Brocadia sp.]|nr:hypothetical protein [Candidatus Brocadia sp.]
MIDYKKFDSIAIIIPHFLFFFKHSNFSDNQTLLLHGNLRKVFSWQDKLLLAMFNELNLLIDNTYAYDILPTPMAEA